MGIMEITSNKKDGDYQEVRNMNSSMGGKHTRDVMRGARERTTEEGRKGEIQREEIQGQMIWRVKT